MKNDNKVPVKLLIEGGSVSALYCGEKNIISDKSPVFRMRLCKKDGCFFDISSEDAAVIKSDGETMIFSGFSGFDISVILSIEPYDGIISAELKIENRSDAAIEWVIPLPLHLIPLSGDGGEQGTELLLPYNEGLITDSVYKLNQLEPEYPSRGDYMIFPNMIFAQTASLLFYDNGKRKALTVSAYDKKRGLKEINVRNGELIFKIYCGAEFGDDIDIGFPLVISGTRGGWEDSLEDYRKWFAENPPPKALPVINDDSLPEWYNDDILVVTYPVRGIHDMDDMKPNALYPYKNVLPYLDEIKKKTGMRLLVLLMHWEGTAPWAPPYVWPPYGGEKEFFEFRDELHRRNDLFGVYCSGFGYTERSNLIPEYDMTERIIKENVTGSMCAGRDGMVKKSRICTAQRSGYDICPASVGGKEILFDAYKPLFESGIDYAQILDQNHGGGQYLCYSPEHGHPRFPGTWVTENMQDMLTKWNKISENMLLGCESAAAEPFIGNLLFSDCRYELCYDKGRPVPEYAYLYHRYLKNFMGNQVCSPLPNTTDALLYRIAYSFSIGDAPTLVLTPDGDISPAWGTRDFSIMPGREETLGFLKTLSDSFKNGISVIFKHGKMIPSPDIECVTAPFGSDLPSVITTVWECKGKKTLIAINPFAKTAVLKINGKEITIESRNLIISDI